MREGNTGTGGLGLPEVGTTGGAEITSIAGGAPSTGGADGGTTDAVSSELSTKENGNPCFKDGECTSTHCVDQVCCDSVCEGQCQACNLDWPPGHCLNLTSGQPVGNHGACVNAGQTCGGRCTGDAECTYPDSSQVCDSTSVCLDSTTERESLSCDGLGHCSIQKVNDCLPDVCNINMDGKCGPAVYTQVDVSEMHSCGVVSDGTLRCWGSNDRGQLGPQLQSCNIPYAVPGLNSVIAVATGWGHTCVLLRNSSVLCWGSNSLGELGCAHSNPDAAPMQCSLFTEGSTVAQLVAGEQFTCARQASGAIQCWGNNDSGQLGDGRGGSSRFSDAPVDVSGITNATYVTPGVFHACAVLGNGVLKCWGRNPDGNLGTGDQSLRTAPATVLGVDGVNNSAVLVAATGDHTCAILTDGAILCFGQGGDGQLGNGTNNSLVPVRAQSPMTANALALGGQFTCAWVNPQSIKCWGTNYLGQLGNGSFDGSPSPVMAKVPNSVSIKAIVGKYYHTCALSTEGRVWCWGRNDNGQLGNSTFDASPNPTELSSPGVPR